MAEWFGAQDLKSGGLWFKSSTLPLSGCVLGSPEFNCCSLPPVRIRNSLCSMCNICVITYSVPN